MHNRGHSKWTDNQNHPHQMNKQTESSISGENAQNVKTEQMQSRGETLSNRWKLAFYN